MSKGIFRKIAVEKASHLENLDEVLTVVKPMSFFTNIVIMFVIISMVYWVFNGIITDCIKAEGILINELSIEKITSAKSARVLDVKVNNGNIIDQNTLLMELEERDEANGNGKKVQLFSEFPGEILRILVVKGDVVALGDVLMFVQKNIRPTELKGLFYVPYKESNAIQIGMSVKIDISNDNKESSTELFGVVESVSKYPVVFEDMAKKVPFKGLIEEFFTNGPVAEVSVNLERDEKSYFGLKIKTNNGRSAMIENGTFCSGQITISDKKPINILFRK